MMMLANIGINQSALFLAIFSTITRALPISVSASRRLTSKASKQPNQAFPLSLFVVSRTPSTGYVISAL